MCGITGFVDFGKSSSEDTLHAMSQSIVHRGPDDSGCETFETPEAQIGFGFRRLSIIDLSPLGHQPMHFPEAGLSIIFNGEIYNYREIRKELEVLGHRFRSQSDTEVILKSYAQWGRQCVQRFIGMFAIALFDRQQNRVLLMRDRAGVKPLFYYHNKQLLLFGSELKVFHNHPGFKKEINMNALAQFFQRGYISAPHSIFNNTFKLLPGHLLEIDLNTKQVHTSKYWDVVEAYNQPKLRISYVEAIEETERLLQSAFQYRMIADVPVGVFLSGGYDSTAVTALLQKSSSQRIKTFTIGFEDPKFNEAQHAKLVAQHLGTEHFEHTCTYRDALDIVPQLPHIYDEPFGDLSSIPTTLVSRMAREQVTVALSADGGDEIFAGYPKYFNALKRISQLGFIPGFVQSLVASFIPIGQSNFSLQNKNSKLKSFYQHQNPVQQFDIISQGMTLLEVQQLLEPSVSHLHTPFDEGKLLNSDNDLLSRFQATEYKTYMVDDILQKVDRATMSISLEGREPFLDQRVIEFVARLPSSYKYHRGVGKRILKDIVHKQVPAQIMQRPKMGFGVPMEYWLRNELRQLLIDYVNERTLKEQGIFNLPRAIKLRDDYLAGKAIEFQRLSYLFIFQLWWHRWMKG